MLRPAFEVLGGRGLRIDYANARDLAERIVGGEEVDVFASASPDHPRRLREAGLVGEGLAFATNGLVVAVAEGSDASDYGVLGRRGTRVVIEVGGIPLGDYTRAMFGRVDELVEPGFEAAVMANVVRQAQTVFEVGDLLVGGEADAGVLYATDVAARPGQLRAIELPRAAAVGVTCVACAVAASTRPGEAAEWVGELVGPAVQAVLREAGFGPAPAGG
jgi:molybdate transport system substrate-binding protein